MANRYKGVGRKFQIGEESTYGTLATTLDMNLNFLSESLKYEVKKEAEESLLATTTVNALNTTEYNVSGDVSLTLKPENLPFLKYAFTEAADPTLVSTGVYKHTLTLLAPGTDQQSFSSVVDRGAKVVGYTGCLIDSLDFQGDARTPISLKATIKGHAEVDGTLNDTLDDPALDSFNALNGTVTIGGSTLSDVTSAKISISNALDDGEATYGSGLYANKHEHGLKDVKPSIDAFYNTATSTIRETDYKGNVYVAESIEWVSSSLVAAGHPYSIKFIMPKVSITEASPTVSGKDTIKITLDGLATGNGSSVPLTIEVIDGTATKY